jgi:phage tail-like protein
VAQKERDIDPYNGHYFSLMIDSTEVAHFQECSGLKSSTTVFEIEEGGLNGVTHKRPGQARWENIVLRYATNASVALVSWRDTWLRDGFAARRSGSITICDMSGNAIRRYNFTRAWPVSWEGPQLNSGSSELAVETIEIAHEGLTVS